MDNSKALLTQAENGVNSILLLIEEHEIGLEDSHQIKQHLNSIKNLYQAILDNEKSTDLDKVTAGMGIGWVQLRSASRMSSYEESKALLKKAIHSIEQALTRLDGTVQAGVMIKGYLDLIECLLLLGNLSQDFTRRNKRIETALDLIRSCEHLCQIYENSEFMFKLTHKKARVLGERYIDNRDTNLFEAIRYSEKAVGYISDKGEQYPISLPVLHNEIGNYYSKIGSRREEFLKTAEQYYSRGFELARKDICPVLHKTLQNNIQWVQQWIRTGQRSLPENEMVARVKTQIQSASDAGESPDKFLSIAWEFLQACWSLPETPNFALSNAHSLIGDALWLSAQKNEAIIHYYCSLHIALFVSDNSQYAQLIVLQAENMLKKVLKKEKYSNDEIEGYQTGAKKAFQNSMALCDRARDIITANPESALEAADQSIAWYPFLPDAWFYKGVALMSLSRIELANESFSTALSINPNEKNLWVNRSVTFILKGRYKSAQKDLEIALELCADDSSKSGIRQRLKEVEILIEKQTP